MPSCPREYQPPCSKLLLIINPLAVGGQSEEMCVHQPAIHPSQTTWFSVLPQLVHHNSLVHSVEDPPCGPPGVGHPISNISCGLLVLIRLSPPVLSTRVCTFQAAATMFGLVDLSSLELSLLKFSLVLHSLVLSLLSFPRAKVYLTSICKSKVSVLFL